MDSLPASVQQQSGGPTALLKSSAERLGHTPASVGWGQRSGSDVQVLTKSPEGKGIDEGDMFRFNAGFTDKMRRIKVCSCGVGTVAPNSFPCLIWLRNVIVLNQPSV